MILFKYASRSRPELFFQGLDTIRRNVADQQNFKVLCSFDDDDQSMNNPEVIKCLDSVENLTYFFGLSRNKVAAINRDMEKSGDWDILINMSDDMAFEQYGFDTIIRARMLEHFPDLDGVLHFNDGYAGNSLMSMTIEGRKYYERFGYIYHPEYVSVYCDDEALSVARLLKKVAYYPNVLFRHNHPGWGRAPMDEQYERTESFYPVDLRTYSAHRARNFDLNLDTNQ